jgi:hypothetical protein
MNTIKNKRKNPNEINPYDLNQVGGIGYRCKICGLRLRPKNINPYDASQHGFVKYCKCK